MTGLDLGEAMVLEDAQRHLYITTGSVRIGTDLMGGLDELLRGGLIQIGDLDL